MKKLISIISLLLITAIVFTGCTSGTSDSGSKILRTNNSSEPGSLDPALAQGTHESWILDHTFEGLFKKAEDGTVVPGMTESYTLADDQVTYTFTLRMILNGQMENL